MDRLYITAGRGVVTEEPGGGVSVVKIMLGGFGSGCVVAIRGSYSTGDKSCCNFFAMTKALPMVLVLAANPFVT